MIAYKALLQGIPVKWIEFVVKIKLDYIPDLNPSNAKDWLDRFLKLRMFL
jgi:hypothetical protein